MVKKRNNSRKILTLVGILFAISGMLIGSVPGILMLGFLGERAMWVAGMAIGICVSAGFEFGAKRGGSLKMVIGFIMSAIGSLLVVQLGYTFYLNEQMVDETFIEIAFYVFERLTDGFLRIREDITYFFSSSIEAVIIQDLFFAIAIGTVISWMSWIPVKTKEDV